MSAKNQMIMHLPAIFSLSHASNYRMREMRFDRLLRATQLDYIFFSFQEHNVNGFENISV